MSDIFYARGGEGFRASNNRLRGRTPCTPSPPCLIVYCTVLNWKVSKQLSFRFLPEIFRLQARGEGIQWTILTLLEQVNVCALHCFLVFISVHYTKSFTSCEVRAVLPSQLCAQRGVTAFRTHVMNKSLFLLKPLLRLSIMATVLPLTI